MKKAIYAAVMCSALLFAACDKDDDKGGPENPVVTDVYGNYQGKMAVTPLEVRSNVAPGTDIAAEVKNDTIYFDDFPVDDLITSIVGEEAAPGIIEAIGTVKYKVGYKASLNEAKDSIYLTMTPEPLELEFLLSLVPEADLSTVKVTITAPSKAGFAYASDNLRFDLNAEEVFLDGNSIGALFTPARFMFALHKE